MTWRQYLARSAAILSSGEKFHIDIRSKTLGYGSQSAYFHRSDQHVKHLGIREHSPPRLQLYGTTYQAEGWQGLCPLSNHKPSPTRERDYGGVIRKGKKSSEQQMTHRVRGALRTSLPNFGLATLTWGEETFTKLKSVRLVEESGQDTLIAQHGGFSGVGFYTASCVARIAFGDPLRSEIQGAPGSGIIEDDVVTALVNLRLFHMKEKRCSNANRGFLTPIIAGRVIDDYGRHTYGWRSHTANGAPGINPAVSQASNESAPCAGREQHNDGIGVIRHMWHQYCQYCLPSLECNRLA
ncbi:hypothetical protein ARMSODRAFT_980437 [Armillaria solidipes]|uniref:Uncharacterized protein n=1 Tax=Armillaria solidipes TaxID=1076256 RepID=A0A2H3B9Q9_9AGAR|nr:hypothetical protein ARMSODRAFT_980437 [Armillaria solidipes]